MNIEWKLRKVTILYAILLIFILCRVFFLAVLRYEKMHKLSILPRRKSVLIPPSRGLIFDSNHDVIACNMKKFDVAISYKDIKKIPSYETLFENGQKTRFPKRKQYIEDLSRMLSEHTNMRPLDIEDFIYSKAALFQDTPLVLIENIPDKAYHKLKILEKDWPGLKIFISQKRFYPKNKVGCHVAGFLGSIDIDTYRKHNSQRKILKEYIGNRELGLTPPLPFGFRSPDEVYETYKELTQKNYELNDLIGIDGIEKTFDQKLKGGAGRKSFETTRLGHIISELPGSYNKKKPCHVQLNIDLSLQEKAETLLAERESNDDLFPKGGAIVVLDLKESQVKVLASYPRFDPQDFIDKNMNQIHKWTESDTYIQRLYEGIEMIEKEKFYNQKGFFVTKQRLTYEHFLKRLLSDKSLVLEKLLKSLTVKDALILVDSAEKLHEKFGFIELQQIFKDLGSGITFDEETDILYEPCAKLFKSIKDPVLMIDLLRLWIDPKKISSKILTKLQNTSLSEFFSLTQDLAYLYHQFEHAFFNQYEETFFQDWRQKHFKEFLKKKREIEAEKKTYARPYIDYLNQEKKRQYHLFLKRYQSYFLAYLCGKIPNLKPELSPFYAQLLEFKKEPRLQNFLSMTQDLDLEKTALFFSSFQKFTDLNKPLYGSYPRLLNKKNYFLKDLARAFYPKHKLGYLRSNAYRHVAPQGSVFKVAVAYQALKEKSLGRLKKIPVIQDALSHDCKNKKEQVLGYDENKQPIKRWHKGGLMPRSSHSGLGHVDLVSALEQSSNIYFSLLASDYIQDPLDLIDSAQKMGLGKKTGIELPYEMKGKIPSDIHHNKTGLYAFAIGQHELLVTPIQTAQMMASFFQEGKIHKPQIVAQIEEQKTSSDDLFQLSESTPFLQELAHLGCFFPLFTETITHTTTSHKKVFHDEIRSEYALNSFILEPIKKGLDKVVWGEKGTARPQAIATILKEGELQKYMQLKHKLIGKTGTAEQRVIEFLDQEAEARMLNHIWFSAISFCDTQQKEPELAICVYLKDGKLGGKEAAPLAAKLLEYYQNSLK